MTQLTTLFGDWEKDIKVKVILTSYNDQSQKLVNKFCESEEDLLHILETAI